MFTDGLANEACSFMLVITNSDRSNELQHTTQESVSLLSGVRLSLLIGLHAYQNVTCGDRYPAIHQNK